MKRFSSPLIACSCISALLLGMSASAYATNTDIPGVTTSGATTSATFSLTTDATSGKIDGPFATSDYVNISGTVNADPAHVGMQARLFLLARANGDLFNIDAFGIWHPWTSGNLKPATGLVKLENQNSISIANQFQNPGAYEIYIGYQLVNDSNLTYSATPATFTQSDFVFEGIDYPISVEDKKQIKSSTQVTVNGESHPIGYATLVRTNQQLPLLGGASGDTATFGLLTDINGDAFVEEDGSPAVCTNGSGPDHTSLLTYNGSLFAVTQLECSNGGAYITKLNQAPFGQLSAVSTRPVDFSGVFGTYVNCAGMTTPWNTHLGSEEYEPPMSEFNPNAENQAWFDSPTWHDKHIASIAAYNKIENNAANAAYMGYYYGWIPEISITSENGDHEVKKHFAMGRAAFEQGYVMPDLRTVYMSDDGTNTGFYMFIADKQKDLSAGTLYAARWDQTSGEGVGAADISWVNLGHATSAEIRAALDNKTTFSDMFNKADFVNEETGTCPSGFSSSQANGIKVCVQLKAGMDKIASRLEMRLYASIKGATTEFRKEEGITYNPEHNVLYVAMSEVRKGMEDNSSNDVGGPNHVRIAQANKCGAVYALDVMASTKDTNGNAINSNYVVGNMYGVVAGIETDYTGTQYEGNSCSVDGIASPDNLTYLPKYGTLIIGEDTGKHQNDLVWAYNVVTKALTRVAYTPYGSETTSPFWHKNINGFGYLTLVTQHPYGESDEDKADSEADKESYIGVIGPFPVLE